MFEFLAGVLTSVIAGGVGYVLARRDQEKRRQLEKARIVHIERHADSEGWIHSKVYFSIRNAQTGERASLQFDPASDESIDRLIRAVRTIEDTPRGRAAGAASP